MTPTSSAAVVHRRPASRILSGLACGLLVTGLVAGCGSDGAMEDAASDASQGQLAESLSEPAPAAADAESAQQMVTTGTVELVVADPIAAAQEISALVDQAGGRTEERDERVRTETSEPRADLTVRVPSDKVTPTIAALADIGTVEATRISSTDVGGQARDLDARIKALQTSAARLETLMSTAATTADLIDAESTLTARQGDLESLQAQRNALADQVEMSTLVVSLTTEPVATQDAEDDGFLAALGTGWQALLSTLAAIVVIVGVALPWVVVGAVVWFSTRWVVRRLRARRRASAPSAPSAPLPPTAPRAPGVPVR